MTTKDDDVFRAMQARLADLLPRLNERDRRVAMATEAKSWGRGGISAVQRATVGVLMALNMMGAWIFVHTGGVLALDHTGPELIIALGLLSLVLAVSGSGRLGLDHLIVRRVRRRVSTA